MMTVEQAVEVLKTRFPNCDVNTNVEVWWQRKGIDSPPLAKVSMCVHNTGLFYNGEGNSWKEACNAVIANEAKQNAMTNALDVMNNVQERLKSGEYRSKLATDEQTPLGEADGDLGSIPQ